MSHLQKNLAKAKISSARHASMAPPPPPPLLAAFNEVDEDHYGASSGSIPNTPQDDDSSSASSVSSTGTVIPSPGRALFARPQGFPNRSLDPIPWTTYFERELFLPSPDGSITYHAYLTSPAPAAAPGKPPAGPLFVMHHGAGSSGLSFAVLGAEVRKRLPAAGILSLDARGHGLTRVEKVGKGRTREGHGQDGDDDDDDEKREEVLDLSLPTLAADLRAVLTLTQEAMRWPALPPVLLVGHSLGGAVVTEFASSLARSSPFAPSTRPTGLPMFSGTRPCPPPPPPAPTITTTTTSPATTTTTTTPASAGPPSPIDLLGYAVLDVVEGSALEALQSMHAYLASRPGGFDSLRDAVEWHVRSRTVRNAISARASVPGLLVHRDEGAEREEEGAAAAAAAAAATAAAEEEESIHEPVRVRGGSGGGGRRNGKPWRWRTDLAKTQPFWEGWFSGLSKKFLTGRGGKLLLLAGTDRLDTELTIGQMQGKYALQVFPEAGHFIHEDLPEKTATVLVDFYRRNDRSALVLPPKVSELLAQGKKV
ncbi:hypothetical protein VTJ83DRAFT_547 [Remersonia thermophila]|uniref:Protein phosphatase methylesterase 1 n=1 Tax=Remersonia thermophila TaxID=72144 RepID=A0ABR4DM85_9PEZI